MTVLQTDGLSHSDIRGSGVICTSPQLFAAYHVLPRLDEPRHPPCALSYFLRLSPMTAYLPGGRPYFQLYRPARGHAPLKRRATSGKSSLFLLIQSCLCQYVKDRRPGTHSGRTNPCSCSVNGTVVVENNGFEPLTPCLQSRCSSQLS